MQRSRRRIKITTTRGTRGKHLVHATHIPPGKISCTSEMLPELRHGAETKERLLPQSVGLRYAGGVPIIAPTRWMARNTLSWAEDHKTGDVENTEECFSKLAT